MGLILRFLVDPLPLVLNVSDDGLAALVHVDVLNCDLLLPFTTVTVERLKQSYVGARELTGLVQVAVAHRQLRVHRAAVALHRSVVASDELGGKHAF